MQEDFVKRALESASTFNSPTLYVMALIFDADKKLNVISDAGGSNIFDPIFPLEQRQESLLQLIQTITRFWKLAQVYADPNRSSEEINTYQVNTEYLMEIAFGQ